MAGLSVRQWIVAAADFEGRGDRWLREAIEDELENRFAEAAPCVRLSATGQDRLLLQIHAQIQAELDVVRPWRAARPSVDGLDFGAALYLAEEWRDSRIVSPRPF